VRALQKGFRNPKTLIPDLSSRCLVIDVSLGIRAHSTEMIILEFRGGGKKQKTKNHQVSSPSNQQKTKRGRGAFAISTKAAYTGGREGKLLCFRRRAKGLGGWNEAWPPKGRTVGGESLRLQHLSRALAHGIWRLGAALWVEKTGFRIV